MVGTIVEATPDSIAYAVLEQGGNLNEKFQASLIDGSSKYVWPFSGYVYFILRTKSHIGNCERRKRAMRTLYNFYFSPTVHSISKRYGYAPIPSFIATLITNVLIQSVKCSDDTYALPELMKVSTTNIALTTFMLPALSVYQSTYSVIESAVNLNLVNTDLSVNAWNNFINNSSLYGSAFTYFPSTSKKLEMYSKLQGTILTSALVHVPVVIGKNYYLTDCECE